MKHLFSKLINLFNKLMFEEKQLEVLPSSVPNSRGIVIFLSILLGYIGIDLLYLKNKRWWLPLAIGTGIPLLFMLFGGFFVLFAYIAMLFNYIYYIYRIAFYISLSDVCFDLLYNSDCCCPMIEDDEVCCGGSCKYKK